MITSAATVPEPQLRDAMTAAFADYALPMNPSPEAFALMMRSRGLAPQISQLAWVDGQIAAFWLVGKRGARAYLISSGTLPPYRRRGLSQALGKAALEAARRQGVRRFQTEVLENNFGAQALYKRLGFERSRKLACFSLNLMVEGQGEGAVAISMESAAPTDMRNFQDVWPSWQNETTSLMAAGGAAKWLTISDREGIAGYAAMVPAQSNLAQIAVRLDQRRQGLGTALVACAQTLTEGESLRILNVDERSQNLIAFLDACGAERTLGQFELVMEL